MNQIVVASKGRPEGKTFELLRESGLEAIIFVEPQEVAEYRACNPEHIISALDKSGQGIAYVRQQILEFFRVTTHPWFWMLDDDISGFFVSDGKKNARRTAHEVLSAAETLLTAVKDLAQGALEYQQYAWSAKKPIKLDTFCDVAVFVNVNRTRQLSYRPEVAMKEDRDFTMQCIRAGWRTARTSQLSFAAPKNGSNEGGLFDDYKAKKEAATSQRMVEIWPGICELHTKDDGRPDVKIDWKKLAAQRDAGAIPVHCAHTSMEDPNDLKPDPENPNQHPEEQIVRLAEVIKLNGWRAPVTVSKRSGLITKGHGRLLAAKRLGCRVPVDYQPYKDRQEEMQDLLADNRLFELGQTDDEKVTKLLEKMGADLTVSTGYSPAEMDRLMKRLAGPVEAMTKDPDPPGQASTTKSLVLHFTLAEHEEFERLQEKWKQWPNASAIVKNLLERSR
jgi:hypothetical protein